MTAYDRILDQIQTHGLKIRRTGTNTYAQCPAHKDNNPSLSITDAPDRVLLHCHAGCTIDAITAALNIKPTDLYNEPATKAPQNRVITAKYTYTDGDGNDTHRVLRYSDKTFSQQHTTDNGHSWSWGKGDQPRPLYQLAQLQTGAIWYVEGEKDVHTAIDLGLNATTTPGGAGKWEPQWTDQIAQRDVIIIPDNDIPGRNHAQKTAAHLYTAGSRVKILHLPDLPEKGDLTDWVTLGGTRNQIHRHAQNTPLWTPDQTTIEATDIPDGITPINWPDFWTQTNTEDWLVEPILPRGRLIALYAQGKAGKSLLALELAAALATGRPVIDTAATDPQSVLYIDQEMTADDLIDRMTDLGYGPDTDLTQLHYYQLQSIPPLDTAEGGSVLLQLVETHQPTLVIIDTVARIVEGEENNADTYRDLYRHTLQPIKARRITTLRLDHAGKDPKKGQRGSSAKNDDVDVVWKLTATEGTDQTAVQLHADRRRMGWVPQQTQLIRTQEGELRHYTDDTDVITPALAELIAVLEKLQIPPDTSIRDTKTRLTELSVKTGTKKLNDAIRIRRKRAQKHNALNSGNTERNTGPEPRNDGPETPSETPRNAEPPVRNAVPPPRGKRETDLAETIEDGATVYELDFTRD